MNDFVFELDIKGVGELLKSDMIYKELNSIATDKTSGLAGNYTTVRVNGKSRTYVTIKCADKKTYYRNLHGNELVKGVGV